jgi:hypothetical protein
MTAAAIIPALIQAAAAAGAGYLSRDKGKSLSKIEKRKVGLLDQILDAAKGQGPLAGLVAGDEDAFQRSIVQPAQQKFQDVTAPGIQQQFISSRLQRGTGLDDALSRAGIDMDTLMNQQFLEYMNSNKDRMMQLITGALGANPPTATPGRSGLEGSALGLTGYIGGEGGQKDIKAVFEELFKDKQPGATTASQGFVGSGSASKRASFE